MLIKPFNFKWIAGTNRKGCGRVKKGLAIVLVL
jgi:hypothetical protein